MLVPKLHLNSQATKGLNKRLWGFTHKNVLAWLGPIFSIKFNGKIRMYTHAWFEKYNVQFVESGTNQQIRLREWEFNIGKSTWFSPIKMGDRTVQIQCYSSGC